MKRNEVYQRPRPRKKVEFRLPSGESPSELEGEGIADWFRPRDSYNNKSRQTLESLGRYPIVGITLSRAPIQSMIRKALDVVSLGAFSRAASKYGFDKLFHLSMLVDLEIPSQGGGTPSRRRVVVEKNAVINISSSFKAEPDAEYYPITVDRVVTLNELMSNTQRIMGPKYFPYNAWTNNCQVFIREVLASNGFNSKGAQDWLFQNVEQLASELPEVSNNITNAVTYTGAVVDKLSGAGDRGSPLVGGSIEARIHESIARARGSGKMKK